ncbi:Imm1 family immunity protein [Lentzea sp. NPDC034063]|uniref:Imm1 family immunity protein n=1 Tax=unclassified Lentzea TaxID=2643253 RepID=UPI0033EC37D5
MIVTAVLSTGLVVVANGPIEVNNLISEVLHIDHRTWETLMFVGDEEVRSTKEGPQPGHQLRVSVIPTRSLAALNYMDHDDPEMMIANSYNPARPLPEVDLIFSGDTGAVFPRSAAISVDDARIAMTEWANTRKRPTHCQWRAYDSY